MTGYTSSRELTRIEKLLLDRKELAKKEFLQRVGEKGWPIRCASGEIICPVCGALVGSQFNKYRKAIKHVETCWCGKALDWEHIIVQGDWFGHLQKSVSRTDQGR